MFRISIDLVIFGNNAKLGDRIPEGTIRDKDFKKFYRNLPTRMNAQEIGSTAQSITVLNKDRAKLKAMHKQKIRQKRKGL